MFQYILRYNIQSIFCNSFNSSHGTLATEISATAAITTGISEDLENSNESASEEVGENHTDENSDSEANDSLYILDINQNKYGKDTLQKINTIWSAESKKIQDIYTQYVKVDEQITQQTKTLEQLIEDEKNIIDNQTHQLQELLDEINGKIDNKENMFYNEETFKKKKRIRQEISQEKEKLLQPNNNHAIPQNYELQYEKIYDIEGKKETINAIEEKIKTIEKEINDINNCSYTITYDKKYIYNVYDLINEKKKDIIVFLKAQTTPLKVNEAQTLLMPIINLLYQSYVLSCYLRYTSNDVTLNTLGFLSCFETKDTDRQTRGNILKKDTLQEYIKTLQNDLIEIIKICKPQDNAYLQELLNMHNHHKIVRFLKNKIGTKKQDKNNANEDHGYKYILHDIQQIYENMLLRTTTGNIELKNSQMSFDVLLNLQAPPTLQKDMKQLKIDELLKLLHKTHTTISKEHNTWYKFISDKLFFLESKNDNSKKIQDIINVFCNQYKVDDNKNKGSNSKNKTDAKYMGTRLRHISHKAIFPMTHLQSSVKKSTDVNNNYKKSKTDNFAQKEYLTERIHLLTNNLKIKDTYHDYCEKIKTIRDKYTHSTQEASVDNINICDNNKYVLTLEEKYTALDLGKYFLHTFNTLIQYVEHKFTMEQKSDNTCFMEPLQNLYNEIHSSAGSTKLEQNPIFLKMLILLVCYSNETYYINDFFENLSTNRTIEEILNTCIMKHIKCEQNDLMNMDKKAFINILLKHTSMDILNNFQDIEVEYNNSSIKLSNIDDIIYILLNNQLKKYNFFDIEAMKNSYDRLLNDIKNNDDDSLCTKYSTIEDLIKKFHEIESDVDENEDKTCEQQDILNIINIINEKNNTCISSESNEQVKEFYEYVSTEISKHSYNSLEDIINNVWKVISRINYLLCDKDYKHKINTFIQDGTTKTQKNQHSNEGQQNNINRIIPLGAAGVMIGGIGRWIKNKSKSKKKKHRVFTNTESLDIF